MASLLLLLGAGEAAGALAAGACALAEEPLSRLEAGELAGPPVAAPLEELPLCEDDMPPPAAAPALADPEDALPDPDDTLPDTAPVDPDEVLPDAPGVAPPSPALPAGPDAVPPAAGPPAVDPDDGPEPAEPEAAPVPSPVPLLLLPPLAALPSEPDAVPPAAGPPAVDPDDGPEPAEPEAAPELPSAEPLSPAEVPPAELELWPPPPGPAPPAPPPAFCARAVSGRSEPGALARRSPSVAARKIRGTIDSRSIRLGFQIASGNRFELIILTLSHPPDVIFGRRF